MVVLGISGSLRSDSYNTRLLLAAARRLPLRTEFRELTCLQDIPPYNQDIDSGPGPQPVRELRACMESADAILVSTPEYNHSVPGQLKNALDWASRPFPDNCLRDVPVGVIGASTSLFGGVWAQAELRKVLAAAGADVLQAELGVPRADEAFDSAGELRDPELRGRLAAVACALVAVRDDRRTA